MVKLKSTTKAQSEKWRFKPAVSRALGRAGSLTSPSLLLLLLAVLELLGDFALMAARVVSVRVLAGLLLGSAFPGRALCGHTAG